MCVGSQWEFVILKRYSHACYISIVEPRSNWEWARIAVVVVINKSIPENDCSINGLQKLNIVIEIGIVKRDVKSQILARIVKNWSKRSPSKECPAGNSMKDFTAKKRFSVLEKQEFIAFLHFNLATRHSE